MIAERKVYPSLDITKFLMAMLILLSHTQNEYAADASPFLHDLLALSNYAVPFFFSCSGFLFFEKLNSLVGEEKFSYYKRWSIRLGKMYLAWTLIYFAFVACNWIFRGATGEGIAYYFHRLIVSTSYPTIWFLPALWVGVSVSYYLTKHCPQPALLFIAIVLWLICSLGECYRTFIMRVPTLKYIWELYMDVFLTFRNGLLFGTPFVLLGYFVTKQRKEGRLWNNLLLTILFCAAFGFESIIIRKYNFSPYSHCGFLLLPAIYYMIKSLIQINIPLRPIYTKLRNYSMLIFLSQRLFLTAIPSVSLAYLSFLKDLSPYLTILFVATVVVLFSIIIELLSNKIKFLKLLW